MKKLIVSIVSVIVIISVLAGAVFALTMQEDAKAEKLDTIETLSKIATSANGNYSVKKLNQKEIFQDLSAENISDIMTAFDVIIRKNDFIELSSEFFVRILFESNDIFYKVTDDKITVSTDVDNNVLKYAMFASVFIENFPENVFRFDDPRLFSDLGAPIGKSRYHIAISFDYSEKGYDDAFSYLSEFYVGNITELGDKTYLLSCSEVDMYAWEMDSFQNPAPNLLECLTDDDCTRIQKSKGTYVPNVDLSDEEH